MSRFTKSSTALFLCLFYSIVGLSGDYLHYLGEDLNHLVFEAQELVKSGYYHTHGPDHHVHFHRHTEHEPEPVVKPNTSQDERSFEIYQAFHQEHACPLLSLVSQLKLGHGGYLPCEIDSTFDFSGLRTYLSRLTVKPIFAIHVRGPPRLS